ncbi:Metallo-beta-lactamase superfamily protein [Mycena chlorophos]|uniref:Metallo-beta-lactamase superfamily protein n=1 Tax=Mycena chlorophos TaxID=658473 RepID=A0A8H6TGF2_MYCCL|nr:Metallo-beta-lactamase superfamily protein [Mycena chlorophos]
MFSPSSFLAFPFLAALPGTFASFSDFGIPSSSATVDVKAFHVVDFTLANLTNAFFSPVLPGRESITLPIHAFLLEHQPSGKLFMFDLAMRNDPQNLTPAFAAFFTGGIATTNPNPFKDITQLLTEGNVTLDSIDTIIWSHTHFDHIGDMSKWPSRRNIIVSSQTNLTLFPDAQGSDLQASDLNGHNVSQVDLTSSSLVISGMNAVDFFNDGSFYLLGAPGHLEGHMIGLARVTPTSFIILGADTAHNLGVLRPSGSFQSNNPCPADILSSTTSSISTDFFWSANTTPGHFDLLSRTQPLLAISDLADSFFVDPDAGQLSAAKLSALDADEDFLTLITHDASLDAALPLFPASLATWQKDGLKEKLAWLFLEEGNPAFLFSPANGSVSSHMHPGCTDAQ